MKYKFFNYNNHNLNRNPIYFIFWIKCLKILFSIRYLKFAKMKFPFINNYVYIIYIKYILLYI